MSTNESLSVVMHIHTPLSNRFQEKFKGSSPFLKYKAYNVNSNCRRNITDRLLMQDCGKEKAHLQFFYHFDSLRDSQYAPIFRSNFSSWQCQTSILYSSNKMKMRNDRGSSLPISKILIV
jgi:hypothetical protein